MSLIYTSSKEYFENIVKDSLDEQGLSTFPLVSNYLVSLLEFFLDSRNLFDSSVAEDGSRPPQTLAELLLTAQQAEGLTRLELLKRLGDRALYISGFFGDSLSRSLVDVDYYRDMGVTAYSSLAATAKEDTLAKLYTEMSEKFVPLSDSLTLISQKAFITSDSSILRLYERYLRTGSDLAKSRLIELGVLTSNERARLLKPS